MQPERKNRTPKGLANRLMLLLTSLDERINPVTNYFFRGTVSSDPTVAANWSSSHLPTGAGDIATISNSIYPYTNPPVLTGTITFPDFEIQSGTFTDNGTLTVQASSLGVGVLDGTGTFNMDSGAASMPATYNHVWQGAAVKVQTVNLAANNFLDIRPDPSAPTQTQMGPDAGNTGSFTINGKAVTEWFFAYPAMNVGWQTIEVQSGGQLLVNNSTSLTNINSATASTHNLFELKNSGGTVTVAGTTSTSGYAKTLDISGGHYTQTGGTTAIQQAAGVTIEDTRLYADGSTSYLKNIYLSGGEADIYSFGTLAATNGDIRFNNANLAVKSCSEYSYSRPPFKVAVYDVGVSVVAQTLMFDGSSILAFQDYTPSNAIAGTVFQVGASLTLTGDLEMGDTATLVLRADVDRSAYDFVTEAPGGEGSRVIGSGTTLKVDVQDNSLNNPLNLHGMLYAGDTGVAQITGMFGSAILTGVAGYSWDLATPANIGNEIDGAIHH